MSRYCKHGSIADLCNHDDCNPPARPLPSSVPPLDPATCLALKPIHDLGNQAMKERDDWNRWSVEIARSLNVSCSDFASDVVAEQFAELRERITQSIEKVTLMVAGSLV
jgi:hypothetical protein